MTLKQQLDEYAKVVKISNMFNTPGSVTAAFNSALHTAQAVSPGDRPAVMAGIFGIFNALRIELGEGEGDKTIHLMFDDHISGFRMSPAKFQELANNDDIKSFDDIVKYMVDNGERVEVIEPDFVVADDPEMVDTLMCDIRDDILNQG